VWQGDQVEHTFARFCKAARGKLRRVVASMVMTEERFTVSGRHCALLKYMKTMDNTMALGNHRGLGQSNGTIVGPIIVLLFSAWTAT
jgi:hypothetical protein